MKSRALFAAALFILPMLAVMTTASACAVPCGRIYPQITIRIPDQLPTYPMTQGTELSLDGELTFKFDISNEGYTVAGPNEPVVVNFEFPRKPTWADLAVTPERIDIPVNDPRFVQADPNGGSPQAWFEYTVPITIKTTVTGQAILQDGRDYAKLLVFAKSTESGLFQAGYGIKEIRISPEGALHESDVAGSRDVFVATELAEFALPKLEGTVLGRTVSVSTPASATFWDPFPMDVTVTPALTGRIAVAIHDEWGNLVSSSGPRNAAATTSLLVTLTKPGMHTISVTLLPDAGSGAAPSSVAIPLRAGDLAPEGFRYPKAALVTATETITAPAGNTADALAQYERDIPFYSFDTAQSVTASLTLTTPGQAGLDRGIANLQFSVHDPDGNMLQAKAVDPTNPTRSLRVGSLPSTGWYVLRITGTGLPAGSSYIAKVETTYNTQVEERNNADGKLNDVTSVLALAGRNLTLPIDALATWAPTPFTPVLDGVGAFSYAMTIHDANGTLALATGLRSGSASFTPPAPGTYTAIVYAEPRSPGTMFAPFVRAFTFTVGADSSMTATTFGFTDAYALDDLAAGPTIKGIYRIPTFPGASMPTLDAKNVQATLVDATGAPITTMPTDGTPAYVRVSATRQDAPTGGTGGLDGTVAFADPVTLIGPSLTPATTANEGSRVPFMTAGLVMALLGAVAVAVALIRRR